MVEVEPDVKPAARYSVSKAAKLLGVDVSTVWRWNQNKKIRIQYRDVDSNPFITGLDISKAWNKTV
jgi:DNA invertase Pin-like site-specific DNA recombinase